MKKAWLNIILLLTNQIYRRKQQVIGQTGLGAVYNILRIIFLEIVLGIVSLPLYLTLRSGKVTAFFSDKGTYDKVAFDYNLRRVLTLTGVIIILIIWSIKLALLIIVPRVYGPVNIFTVSDFRPADIFSEEIIGIDGAMQNARRLNTLPAPKLFKVEKVKSGEYLFSGTGQPNAMVVLLLSGEQTAVYTANTDKNGNWNLQQNASTFRLREGNHSVVVFGYDPKLQVRTPPSPEQYFKVTHNKWDNLIKNIDVLANWSIVILILIGVFLTFLTI